MEKTIHSDSRRHSDHVLPCGLLTCDRESLACLLKGKSEIEVGKIALKCLDAANSQLEQSQIELRRSSVANQQLQQMARRIMIDQKTGFYREAGVQEYFDSLDKSGLLESMHQDRWQLTAVYIDVNLLKQHNSLGGEAEGGDSAIKEVANAIRKSLRRDNDIVFTSSGVDQADQHLNLTKQFSARDGGDEFVSYIFTPPNEFINPQRIAERLIDNLTDRTVVYHQVGQIDPNASEKLNYVKLADGNIEVSVSAIVSVVHALVPNSVNALKEVRATANIKSLKVKQTRSKVTSSAVLSYIFEDEVSSSYFIPGYDEKIWVEDSSYAPNDSRIDFPRWFFGELDY